MVETYEILNPKDKNVLSSLWLCPNDNTLVEKIIGRVSGEQEISRGLKKIDVALNNAIAMKKFKEKDLIHAKTVVQLSFQLLPNDFLTFIFVNCPLCDYEGLAPKLPNQIIPVSQKKHQIIENLIEESRSAYKSEGGNSGGFRRGGIFLWFILISIITYIALSFTFIVVIIAYIFRIGLV